IGGSSEGSVIGWSMKEPVPITASMLKMPEAVNTAIPSVYKAGQWTLSPAGIPTAVMTGHLAVQAIRRAVKKTSGSK
ncbi:MAG: NAD(P)/FAD-dependent oxidoreductase, partial [Treponema sp.]|nr:NAD(P)/FAD-dependent oxidoreductase [Treponema sp.]